MENERVQNEDVAGGADIFDHPKRHAAHIFSLSDEPGDAFVSIAGGVQVANIRV